MSENHHIILTRGLKKTYSDGGIPVHAVRGIDLTIDAGEFSAIVGPSGSGKTTFLNLISGLSGKDLSDFRRDHIGFIFQAYNLIPVLTVEENIEYIMLLKGISREERHQRVMDILERVGLSGLENRKPPQLSGGQQQRVAIARAMVSQPSLILADEPTANLDSETGEELLEIMLSLNKNTGMTFLFSTHDKMVMEKAKRIIILKDGRIATDEKK
jgi:putative ABC transport system ATP-binding protein